jgi:hypothetical protein
VIPWVGDLADERASGLSVEISASPSARVGGSRGNAAPCGFHDVEVVIRKDLIDHGRAGWSVCPG